MALPRLDLLERKLSKDVELINIMIKQILDYWNGKGIVTKIDRAIDKQANL